MPEVTIRPVQKHDLPSVHKMIQALAAHHGDEVQVSLEVLARDLLGDTPWLRVLVAEHDTTLAGYAALCPQAQLQFGVRGMDMHHLFVVEAMRGQGVGQALIAACLNEAQTLGCCYMTVGTHPQNTKAAEVYRAAGFEAMPPPGPRFRIKLKG